MNKQSRFIIGIDLGTTHCALSYFDRYDPQAGIQSLAIPQWDVTGGMVRKNTLPSFIYLLSKAEIKRQDKKLPIHDPDSSIEFIVGREARDRLSTQPDRVIHSAKSWLCHGGINRNAKTLPWQSEEVLGEQRWSPVDVAAALLKHLKQTWDWSFASHTNPECLFQKQQILVTIPASFDEAAQRLTLEACQQAGFGSNVRLIEEPQAAFFDWLNPDKNWSVQIQELFHTFGKTAVKVLVCDVGGGTSDFSILEVSQNASGQPLIKRLKVSNHILLGGDNIDLAIAHRIDQQRKHQSQILRAAAWTRLIHEARKLKEDVLQDQQSVTEPSDDRQVYHITVDHPGASLFEDTETIAVDTEDILHMILDGFFPLCDADDKPQEAMKSGLSEWGLPYAKDSAITRHLAAFIAEESIDAVLFAGGSLSPQILQKRIRDLLCQWQGKEIVELKASSLDLAVSRGATAFARLEEQEKELVAASYPRSVFLKVDHQGANRLLRLIPRGSPVGSSWTIADLKLLALVNQHVEFEVWTSATDRGQEVGELVAIQADFHRLPPMQTILSYPEKRQGQIEVELTAQITQTGLLQIFCVERGNPEQRWALEFQTRDQTLIKNRAEDDATVVSQGLAFSAEQLAQIERIIKSVYGRKKVTATKIPRPQELISELEKILQRERSQWTIPQLRQIWELLKEGMTRRQRSVEHEAAWLHLAGYTLRPGFGALRDPQRCTEMWRCWELGIAHPKEARVLDQWWIMWRRIAGGLSQEQQNILFDRIAPQIRKQQSDQASREMILLAGSLERLEMNRKLQLGRSLVGQLKSGQKQLVDAKIWALSRIASRIPLYGGLEDIVQPLFVEQWIEELSELDPRQKHYNRLVYFYSQAGRRLDLRELDLSPKHRQICLEQLEKAKADEVLIKPVREFCPPDRQLLDQLFGEDLPSGIEIGE